MDDREPLDVFEFVLAMALAGIVVLMVVLAVIVAYRQGL